MCKDLLKFKDDRLLVISKSMETDIIQSMHEQEHLTAKRIEESQEYYIRDLKRKVEHYIAYLVF